VRRSESRRSERLAEEIRRELAEVLENEIQDPRLAWLTLSGVRLNSDLKVAEILYTMSGDPQRIREAKAGLETAKGYLRSALGRRLRMKALPELRFRFDDYLEDMIYGQPGLHDSEPDQD
jgi:ribosome-binding factor A